jgi:hypothetical protein
MLSPHTRCHTQVWCPAYHSINPTHIVRRTQHAHARARACAVRATDRLQRQCAHTAATTPPAAGMGGKPFTGPGVGFGEDAARARGSTSAGAHTQGVLVRPRPLAARTNRPLADRARAVAPVVSLCPATPRTHTPGIGAGCGFGVGWGFGGGWVCARRTLTGRPGGGEQVCLQATRSGTHVSLLRSPLRLLLQQRRWQHRLRRHGRR